MRKLNRQDPFLVDRLLAGRDRLAGREREQVFAAACDRAGIPAAGRSAAGRSAAGRSAARSWKLGFGLAGAAAVAGAAALVVTVSLSSPGGEEEEFASRGGGTGGDSLALSCGDPTAPSRCRSGDKLLFSVSAATDHRYFSAFARREDQTAIWYFPAQPEQQSIAIEERVYGQFLERGILLGEEHPPGRYEVYGLFSEVPYTQEEIKRLMDPEATEDGEQLLLKRSFQVVE